MREQIEYLKYSNYVVLESITEFHMDDTVIKRMEIWSLW